MRTYPYTAFALTSSMKIMELTVIGAAFHTGWVKAGNGIEYPTERLHQTREVAIAAGHTQLDAHAERLEKQAATLSKRRATLNKQVAK